MNDTLAILIIIKISCPSLRLKQYSEQSKFRILRIKFIGLIYSFEYLLLLLAIINENADWEYDKTETNQTERRHNGTNDLSIAIRLR